MSTAMIRILRDVICLVLSYFSQSLFQKGVRLLYLQALFQLFTGIIIGQNTRCYVLGQAEQAPRASVPPLAYRL